MNDEIPAEPPREPDTSLLLAAPSVLRMAFGAGLRTAGLTLSASVRGVERVAQAAVSGKSPNELLHDTGVELRDQARRLLGVVDLEERLRGTTGEAPPPPRDGGPADGDGDGHRPRGAGASLRERGAELLRRSADVDYEEDAHPAYQRILGELAPDEGRILRFLALEGPQPSVDVRVGKALNVGSQMVAPGLSMIGAQAGTRFGDRVPAYLNNLYRLGLIWFSREPLEDPLRYQVLEAQPDVLAALKGGGRGRTVRRSIHLTPFGQDFCETCLPLHTAEIDALPGDAVGSPS